MINDLASLVLRNGDGCFWPEDQVGLPVRFGHAQISHNLIAQEIRIPLDLLRYVALHRRKADGLFAELGPVSFVHGRGDQPGQQSCYQNGASSDLPVKFEQPPGAVSSHCGNGDPEGNAMHASQWRQPGQGAVGMGGAQIQPWKTSQQPATQPVAQ